MPQALFDICGPIAMGQLLGTLHEKINKWCSFTVNNFVEGVHFFPVNIFIIIPVAVSIITLYRFLSGVMYRNERAGVI